MNVRPKLILSLLFALLMTSVSRAEAADRLFATSDGQSIWLAQVTTPVNKDGPATQLLTRAYVSEKEFRVAGTLVVRVRSMVPCPEGVAILSEDGQWLLGWVGGQSTGPEPADGAQLLAMGGDGKVLWAIAAIPPGTPTTAPTTRRSEDDLLLPTTMHVSPTTGKSVATTLPTTQPTVPALYRLDRDQWTRVTDLPLPANTNADDLSLLVADGVPTVGIREGKTVRLLSLDDGVIRAVSRISLTDEKSTFSLLVRSGEIGVAEVIGRGVELRSASGEPIRLNMDGENPVTAAQLLVEAKAIRLFALTSKPSKKAIDKTPVGASGDTIYERSFSLAGVADGAGIVLPQIALPPDEEFVNAVSFAVVVSLTTLLVFAARTHGPITSKAVRKAGYRLAPLLPRLAAGVIDAAPVLAALLWHSANFATLDLLLLARLLAGDTLLWAAIAIYMAHTGVGEALFGRSIGKWLLGLRVVSVEGLAAKPLSILYRTLIRPAELLVPFSLLLIPLTLLRQRPGDIAAGTVVVAKARPGDEEEDYDDEEEEE